MNCGDYDEVRIGIHVDTSRPKLDVLRTNFEHMGGAIVKVN